MDHPAEEHEFPRVPGDELRPIVRDDKRARASEGLTPTWTRITCPEGSLVVTRIGRREWTFEYLRLTEQAYDTFHQAIELWEVGDLASAEAQYRRLIAEWPEFIDVYHHLALVLEETRRGHEAFDLWQATVALGISVLPAEFKVGRDRLPWYHLENRPFLRAYHGLSLEYMARGWNQWALECLKTILSMNPDDNQGVRALAIDCSFRLKRPRGVLSICRRYSGDWMEGILYGRPLALYQLGRRDEAEVALRQAIAALPLVAKELAKERHRRPKGLRPDRITVGGADQAYHYWKDSGQHWEATPGALEWLREHLQPPT